MKSIRSALLCLAAVALPAGALAQGAPTPPDDARTIHPRKTVVTFGQGSDIGGTRVGPGGVLINVPQKPRFSSLVTIRTNFRAELVASAHAL